MWCVAITRSAYSAMACVFTSKDSKSLTILFTISINDLVSEVIIMVILNTIQTYIALLFWTYCLSLARMWTRIHSKSLFIMLKADKSIFESYKLERMQFVSRHSTLDRIPLFSSDPPGHDVAVQFVCLCNLCETRFGRKKNRLCLCLQPAILTSTPNSEALSACIRSPLFVAATWTFQNGPHWSDYWYDHFAPNARRVSPIVFWPESDNSPLWCGTHDNPVCSKQRS